MPKKLGKYEVIEELGKGAMGTVYKAYDGMMARYVALKTMSYTNASDPEFKKRFYKEAQAPGRLHHENIVIIYELNEDEGVPYIAMEFLEGSDLHHLAQSGFILTLKKIIEIMTQVCEGLHFAHQNGIIHRDVKPANIFMLKNGKVKIVDFGIAHISQSSLMTRTGVILGTPSYMSPEQVRSEALTGRSDQFSVGVIMYELLTGRRPFDGDTYTTILYKILHEDPTPLREYYPVCPPELESVIMKALAKNPDDRFVDLAGMARRLRKLQAEMDQDLDLDNTMAFTQVETGEKSLKIELINRYIREGKFDLAVRVLEKLKGLGESPEILEALREDIQEKQRLLRLEALIEEGTRFYEDEHFDLAMECFNEALTIDPENPRILEWVRKTHQKEADRRLRKTIQQYLEKGDREAAKQNFEEALKVYGEALKLNPAAPGIAEKMKHVQHLLDENRKQGRYLEICQQAHALRTRGQREEALALARQAEELLPEQPEARQIIRTIQDEQTEETIRQSLQEIDGLLEKKKLDEALTLADQTMERTGQDPRLQRRRQQIRQVRRKKLLALAAGAVMIVAALVVFLVLQAVRQKPPPPVMAPGFLVLDIRPEAAILTLTDAATGRQLPAGDGVTPLRLSLPPGQYRFTYQNPAFMKSPGEKTVRVQSGRTERINLKLPGFDPRAAAREILGPGGRP